MPFSYLIKDLPVHDQVYTGYIGPRDEESKQRFCLESINVAMDWLKDVCYPVADHAVRTAIRHKVTEYRDARNVPLEVYEKNFREYVLRLYPVYGTYIVHIALRKWLPVELRQHVRSFVPFPDRHPPAPQDLPLLVNVAEPIEDGSDSDIPSPLYSPIYDNELPVLLAIDDEYDFNTVL